MAEVAQDSGVNKVTLNPIDMLSWKLLAVFHDPIHDFGLSIDRMCSIVKYINHVKDEIKAHELDPQKPNLTFTGGAGTKRRYAAKNDSSTLYIEERNIASIPYVVSPMPTDSQHGKPTELTDMYKLYEKLYDNYLKERNWFNNEGKGLTLTGIDRMSEDNNQIHVYRLQIYTQFFTNITKLIDLFKLLIVIQVVNKHGMAEPPATMFSYNNVHKQTVMSAMFNLSLVIGQNEDDPEVERIKNANQSEVIELSFLLNVMEVIFDTISSRHCSLQLDLLNSSTFNNLVQLFFSCYFYDRHEFKRYFPLIEPSNRDDVIANIASMEQDRRKIIDEDKEDLYEDEFMSPEEQQVKKSSKIIYEYETDYLPEIQDYNMSGGKRRKRYNLLRPFIMEGGAGAKFEKWKKSTVDAADQHRILDEKLNQWKDLKKEFYYKNKSPQQDWAFDLYEKFKDLFDEILKITIVKTNFPILFNKMKKDFDYHRGQVEDTRNSRTANTRTNPKATFVTKVSDYMNELTSEIDALKAEMDNEEKRELKKEEKSNMVDSVDTTITNQVSKLMAKKGLEYAQATLEIIRGKVMGTEQTNTESCLEYVKNVLTTQENTKLGLPDTTSLPISYQILMNHIYFLGVAYLQHKNCLPDIDSKLINYWRGLLRGNLSVMSQEELKKLPSKYPHQSSSTKRKLRVVNNGIPSSLKEIFNSFVVCPSSSVCDAMGSFGSCAGIKRENEFISMNIRITNTDESDYYDVYSKVDKKLLEVVSNSFNLNFVGEAESMVIECRLSNINLDIKPEMLSANNVFKVTLGVIEGIMKEQTAPIPVRDLWESLYSSTNFKKIITPTCQKATGDINQELNSIVRNGGYYDTSQKDRIEQINIKKITVGLAGDRPSGVRMILLALHATQRDQLLSSFAVGYANVSESLVVFQGIPPPPEDKKGGRITKTKFRKTKRNNTRKNKLYHYRPVSKRRKYYNNTKKQQNKK